MNNQEIWKDIEGYEGLYQVSNLGRVKSLKRRMYDINNKKIIQYKREKILKSYNNRGYKIVKLTKNGKNQFVYVHRLVCSSFNKLSLNNKKAKINHIDENKSNNNINNLEICSQKYNVRYSIKKNKIAQIKDNKIIKVWNYLYLIEEELGFNKSNICMCCRGKKKTAYGYIWRYVNE